MSDTETQTTQKKGRARWLGLAVLGVALLAGLGWTGWRTFHIAGPHRLMAQNRAVLSTEVEAQIQKLLEQAPPKRMSEAISRAADLTDTLLSPGAGTPADARDQPFNVGLEGREANSDDYAHTFAKVVGSYLSRLRIEHRVVLIESPRASVFGIDLGPRTWVVVLEPRRSVWLQHYVDPLLHDRLGTWNVLGHVDEPLPIPEFRAPTRG